MWKISLYHRSTHSTLDCSNFTNFNLSDAGIHADAVGGICAAPRFLCSLRNGFVGLAGMSMRRKALGDIVTVDDKDLNLSVKTRVVRRQYNCRVMWKTVLNFPLPFGELGDSPHNGIRP